MATTDAPFGFRPIGSLSGAGYVGTLLECAIPGGDGTDTFVGDFVKMDGSSTTAGTLGSLKSGIPTVIQATAGTGNEILGVVVGFAPTPTDLENTYARGADANDRICHVAVADTQTLFLGQEDGAGDALDANDIGSCVPILVGSGSTLYGTSGMEIDSSGTTASGSEQLRLIGLYQDSDNVINAGTTAGSVWVVQVTEPQLGASKVSLGF